MKTVLEIVPRDWCGIGEVLIDGKPESWFRALETVQRGYENRQWLRSTEPVSESGPELRYAPTARRYMKQLEDFVRDRDLPDRAIDLHFLRLGAELYDRAHGITGPVDPAISIESPLSSHDAGFEMRARQAAASAPPVLRTCMTLGAVQTRLIGRYSDFVPGDTSEDSTAGLYRRLPKDVLVMQQGRPLPDGVRNLVFLPGSDTLRHEWGHALDDIFGFRGFSQTDSFAARCRDSVAALADLPAPGRDQCFSRVRATFQSAVSGKFFARNIRRGVDETRPGRRYNLRFVTPETEGGLCQDWMDACSEIFAETISEISGRARPRPAFAATFQEPVRLSQRFLRGTEALLAHPLDITGMFKLPARFSTLAAKP